ncbi:MAG: hypothetical protein WBA10_19020 [Elainellaceae cyanobacterium]
MSTPYQSRLLTFVSERSLKLRDQAQRRLRQVQLAALWGTQVVLYPFYAAFQSTRVISRQVGQTARRAFPRLRAAANGVQQSGLPDPSLALQTPASDSPIRRTLRSLDLFSLPLPITPAESALAPAESSALTDSPSENLALQTPAAPSPSPQIRGIACLLTSQHLVLVDQYSAIHDVLTPTQEQYLRRRLILELAKFWRAHQQVPLAHQSPTPRPLPSDRDTMLPPVRAWWRLMAWMQTSPVAVSANLFQEARLPDSVLHSRLEVASASAVPTYPFPLIEATPPPPALAQLTQPWWSRLLPPWLQGNGRELGIGKYRPDAGEGQATDAPTSQMTPPWFDPDHQGDKKGWENANQIVQRHQAARPPVRPSLPTPPKEQWADLYQADPTLLDEIENYLLGPYGVEGLSSSTDLLQAGDMAIGHSLSAEGISPAGAGDGLSSALRTGGPILTKTDRLAAPLSTAASTTGITSTWLEIQATSLGYERHPLEHILAWVDQGLAWTEAWLMKLLQLLNPSR